MAAVLKETAGLYETLKAEWNKKNPSLNKCGEILSKLKVKARNCDRFVSGLRIENG